MKNHLFRVALVVFLGSCSEPEPELPLGILTKSEMVNLLIDIHLLESAVSTKNLPRDSALLVYKAHEPELFKKHGVPDSVYKASFDYYAGLPTELNTIYGQLVDSLSLKEGQQTW